MALVAVIGAAFAIALAALIVREWQTRRRVARLDEEIGRLRAQMKDAEQLASVGQLVSGLAQELKSPLQGVLGNTELMMASGPHRDTEELRNIQESATRAASLVRNLLAFTETTNLARRWQDVNEIVRRAVDDCRGPFAALGVRVAVSAGERVPLVYVDGRQIEKVVATLLMRLGPRHPAAATKPITITTSRVSGAEAGGDQDDRLIVDIYDPAADADPAAWSGDLDASRTIMEVHGGALRASRPDSGGSLIRLELPLSASVLSSGSDQHG